MTVTTDSRSRELASFLRSRRARLGPDDVGLPPGGRRRVPGLRREEVATLANVGTTWYTWLEQGRPVHPSAEVLASIAVALQLDHVEAAHLMRLGGHAPGDAPSRCERPSERLLAVLDSLSPNPTVLVNRRFDAVAYNASYRFMIGDLDAVPPEDRNIALLHFLHPAWRAAQADREETSAVIVAKLRSYYGDSVDDPSWQPLLARLSKESALFRELWQAGDVGHRPDYVKKITSSVGLLAMTSVSLVVQEKPSWRLSVHLPTDAATAARFALLSAQAAA